MIKDDDKHDNADDAGCAECSKLKFTNCIRCSDVSPVTADSQCYECARGYTLKEDKSSCISMRSWLLLLTYFNVICKYGLTRQNPRQAAHNLRPI